MALGDQRLNWRVVAFRLIVDLFCLAIGMPYTGVQLYCDFADRQATKYYRNREDTSPGRYAPVTFRPMAQNLTTRSFFNSVSSKVGIPIIFIYTSTVPFHRGFFCDDESLMHPYKTNTIPTWAMGFVSTLLPVLCIIVGEGYRLSKNRRWCFPDCNIGKPSIIFVYINALFPLAFSLLATLLITEFTKVIIGRLRPHFLTLCDPDFSTLNCTGFVENVVCRSTDEAALREVRLSFPSGHSSYGTCGMLYLMIYTQKRFTWRKLLLIRPVLQLATFFVVYYTALSRVSDYAHHWSDVVGGAIIGFIIAIAVIRFSTDLLRVPNRLPYSYNIECDNDSAKTTTTLESYQARNTEASQLKSL